MGMQVLILGATGTLGQPVARSLLDRGHGVRVLARSAQKVRAMFGKDVEVYEGDSTDRARLIENLIPRTSMGTRRRQIPS